MITVSLVGGQSPPLVQIVVSQAPNGEAWTLTGSSDDFTWQVPGGAGVGAGGQVSLADNRAPGNRPVIYTFKSPSKTEVSAPITVPIDGDFALSTLDGGLSLTVGLQAGSLDVKTAVQQELFVVPGRPRPVVRYAATSDVTGTLSLLVPISATGLLRKIFAPGAPVLWRFGADSFDLPPVAVFAFGNTASSAYPTVGLRFWEVPYVLVDDPFLDQVLGAFSWELFDGKWAGKTWAQFDAFMQGRTWNQFDTFDWSTL